MPSSWPSRWFERRPLVSGGRRVAFCTIAQNGYSLLAGGFEIALVSPRLAILNFNVLKTEFRLGLFASWIALASAVFFLGVRRLIRCFWEPRASFSPD